MLIQSLEVDANVRLGDSAFLNHEVLEGVEGHLGSCVHCLGGAHYILENLVRASRGLFDRLSCFLECHIHVTNEGDNLEGKQLDESISRRNV